MRRFLSVFVVFLMASVFLVPFVSGPAEAKEEGTRVYMESSSINPKIDPYLELGLKRDDKTKLNYFGEKLSVAIEFTGDDAYVLESFSGLEVRSVIGNLVTAFVPEDILDSVTSSPFVKFIHADKPVELFLDVSVPDTWGNEMWGKTSSGLEVTGKNVIFGIVDTGIDWTHEDFREDFDITKTRIDNIWDQTIEPGDVPEAPPGEHFPMDFTYGVEVDSFDIEAELIDGPDWHDVAVRTRDGPPSVIRGHGTHVSSIAAGDGSESAGLYKGMAPDARFIVVKNRMSANEEESGHLWELSVIDGINYIVSRTQSYGKTAVINLSLGSHYYAHDGSALLDQAIDALSGPGVIFVVAAGNHLGDDLHASGGVPPSDPNPVTEEFEVFWVNIELEQSIWYEDTLMDVAVTTPPDEDNNPQTCGPLQAPTGPPPVEVQLVCQIAGNWWAWDPNLGSVLLPYDIDVTIIHRVPVSGANQILINIDNARTPLRQLMTGFWFYSLWATTGANPSYDYDSWMTFRDYWHTSQPPVYTQPDPFITIAEPATANSAITVGAYVTKPDDSTDDLMQDIAYFSSWGPTRDDREKPDITAPGRGVYAAQSKDLVIDGDPDPDYILMSGTSMSSPHVAGCIALMLQINPALTPYEAKTYIINSATRDPYTPSSGWNEVWGNGRLSCELSAVSLDNVPPEIEYFHINDDADYTIYTDVE